MNADAGYVKFRKKCVWLVWRCCRRTRHKRLRNTRKVCHNIWEM